MVRYIFYKGQLHNTKGPAVIKYLKTKEIIYRGWYLYGHLIKEEQV